MFILKNIHVGSASAAVTEDPNGGTESGGVTTTGLIADYRVENYSGSGNILNDVSGNDLHLNIAGTTYNSTDVYLSGGTAASQLAQVGTFSISAYTIEGWFRAPSALSSNSQYLLAVFGQKLGIKLRYNYGSSTPTGHGPGLTSGFSPGTTPGGPGVGTGWNHIAATFNSSNTYSVYLNGTSFISGTSANFGQNPVTNQTNSIWITNDSNIQWGQVRFYNSALSSSQITSNKNGTDTDYS
jgi:hypothetical protein